MNRHSQVGRVTPCAPQLSIFKAGAHGVTRPTSRFMERGSSVIYQDATMMLSEKNSKIPDSMLS